jgi:hypothetical protein
MKDLYNKNDKSLKKEIKEYIRRRHAHGLAKSKL